MRPLRPHGTDSAHTTEERDQMEETGLTDEQSETPAEEEASASGGAAAGRSPFGRRSAPGDRWITNATYVVLVAIVCVGAFLGWSVFRDRQLSGTQSNAARAVASLSMAAEAAPNDAQVRVQLAEAMMANGQTDDAIEQLQAALSLDKANPTALIDLGLIAMDRKDWKTAEGYWLQLVDILSGDEMSSKDQRLADVYYYLGTTLLEERRYEEAVANLKQSIQIKRDEAGVHYALSVAYQRLELPEMQRQELVIALAFVPTYAEANYELGLLAVKASEVATAAELFRISADNAPSGVTKPQEELAKLGSATDRLASAKRLAKDSPGKALSEARIAAALDPSSPDAVALVAQLWEKAKDKKRALNAWQRLLELVPNDATATAAIKRLS